MSIMPPQSLEKLRIKIISLQAEKNKLQVQLSAAEELLSELYQICGPLVSEKVLDNISAAARRRKLPHKTLLPYYHVVNGFPLSEGK